MLFNSWTFALFLVVVLGVYWTLQVRGAWRWQNHLLLGASYVFYGAWDWRFLGLLGLSTVVDYVAAKQIARHRGTRHRRAWLVFSLVVNLGVLGYFKYCNFFVESAAELMAAIGLPMHPTLMRVVLPVGISFYTFQTISYTVDVYRRKIEPAENLATFALFVAFFPQLVAGPIERAGRLLPQFRRARVITRTQVGSGAWLILFGLFKKMVVADNIGPVVDQVFMPGGDPDGVMVALGTYAFAMQIYCDFSGYTDIARGVAKLMGFELMLNFKVPYVATSPTEFWARWHISLSTWLRDYLFVPLGGARGGKLKTLRNLMITMLLGGLWHGAAWTFAAWGLYHGLLLVVFHVFKRRGRRRVKLKGWRRFAAALGFFQLVVYGGILFRAASIEQAADFTAALVTSFAWSVEHTRLLLMVGAAYALVIGLLAWLRATDEPWTRPGWRAGLGPVVVTGLAWLVLFASSVGAESFIYFQF